MLGETQSILGNGLTREMLTRAMRNRRLHHALLFHGPPGIGKLSVALDLARHLICRKGPDAACSQCDACRRMAGPFPSHPDLHLLRDGNSPVFIDPAALMPASETAHKNVHIEKQMDRVRECLKSFVEKGLLSDHRIVSKSGPAMDRILFSGDRTAFAKSAEKFTQDPLASWMIRKLGSHVEHTYNAAIKIENIRQLQNMLGYQPFEADYKVAVIDDAEKMLDAAQNCFLKTLEEPPGQAILILVSSNPAALYRTIRSRCQPVPFHPLRQDEIQDILIAKFGYDEPRARETASRSEGRMTIALEIDPLTQTMRDSKFLEFFSTRTWSQIDWPVRAAQVVLGDESDGEDASGRLSAFLAFIHERLREMVSGEKMNTPFGPEGHEIEVDHWIGLGDRVSELRRQMRFNLDCRIQLESIFVELCRNLQSGDLI